MGALSRRAARATVPIGAVAGLLLTTGCDAKLPTPGDDAADTGQLTVLSLGPVASWDPQRMNAATDAAFAGRVFLRTLTAFPAGSESGSAAPVGDLATDAGTPDESLRTWSFTLRDGITWQDGSPVTCDDLRHGISRSFAEPFASEGLNYPLAYLDIPRTTKGVSSYQGPDDKDQKAFDKAVACDGRKVTFRLSVPSADFNQIVSLPVFAPVKASSDKGADGKYAVMSNGPYQLKGAWDPSAGGTFVRNPKWDKASDPIRKAAPSTVKYVEGVESQNAVQQVLEDSEQHRHSLTLDSAPPVMQQHILSVPELEKRSVNPRSARVDYLAPNLLSPVMAKPGVRTALAQATNRVGYVTALGGPSAAEAAYSLLSPGVPGSSTDDRLKSGDSGNAAAARATLQAAKVALPVKITVAYRTTPTSDKALAALQNGWEDAGFAVTLKPVDADYFTSIAKPDKSVDVYWANWTPAYPSPDSVLPALFDSRTNLLPDSTGRDYGSFRDDEVDAELTRLAGLADPAERAKGWQALDEQLIEKGAYIALAQHRSMYVAGSGVTGLAALEAWGGYGDLAGIGLS
jgi:peptide/nickel transport system substrate-binding protein